MRTITTTKVTIDTDTCWTYSDGDTFYDITVQYMELATGDKVALILGTLGKERENHWNAYTEQGITTIHWNALEGMEYATKTSCRKVERQIRKAYA